MAFTVAPSADGKYLVCRVSGLLNQELGKAFAVELERMGRELGISRYLIDVRDAVNTLTPLGNYEYAYTCPNSTYDVILASLPWLPRTTSRMISWKS